MHLDLPLLRADFTPAPSIRENITVEALLKEGLNAVRLDAGVSKEDREACASVAFVVVTEGGVVGVDRRRRDDEGALRLMCIGDEDRAALVGAGVGAHVVGVVEGQLVVVITPTGADAGGRASAARESRRLISAVVGPDLQWVSLRRSGQLLAPADARIALVASAITNWNAANGFCHACGCVTAPINGGWARTCSGCGLVEFPRHDPAMIVRIEDESGRILLAHNRLWSDNMCSLLAGFVEAGETPEETVIREVYEEVGLRVAPPTYIACQPWPFPRSLMMGYVTVLAPGQAPEPRPDGDEIEWARFFTREEFLRGIDEGEISAPGSTSIAHALIAHWLGRPIPAPASVVDPLG